MIKPMLAGQADLTTLMYPCFASVKLDGIRALIVEGRVVGRSLKEIPNTHVQKELGKDAYNGFDGELIVGSPTAKDCFRQTHSGVMSRTGEPAFRFWVFDHFSEPNKPYMHRLGNVEVQNPLEKLILKLPQKLIHSEEELSEFEALALQKGFEGVIIRGVNSPYKFGRSTTKEGHLLKLKRFVDDEATIVGFEEFMHNGNEAKTNALGLTERSSHKDNKTGMDKLGALVVRYEGAIFNIGTGFTDAQRKEIWNVREKLKGKTVKFKYFEVGIKDAPRHPVFLGFRDEVDMDG